MKLRGISRPVWLSYLKRTLAICLEIQKLCHEINSVIYRLLKPLHALQRSLSNTSFETDSWEQCNEFSSISFHYQVPETLVNSIFSHHGFGWSCIILNQIRVHRVDSITLHANPITLCAGNAIWQLYIAKTIMIQNIEVDHSKKAYKTSLIQHKDFYLISSSHKSENWEKNIQPYNDVSEL